MSCIIFVSIFATTLFFLLEFKLLVNFCMFYRKHFHLPSPISWIWHVLMLPNLTKGNSNQHLLRRGVLRQRSSRDGWCFAWRRHQPKTCRCVSNMRLAKVEGQLDQVWYFDIKISSLFLLDVVSMTRRFASILGDYCIFVDIDIIYHISTIFIFILIYA